MCPRRAHDAHVQLVRKVNVAGIAPAASDQRQILDARNRMPEYAPLARQWGDRIMAVVGRDVVHCGLAQQRLSCPRKRASSKRRQPREARLCHLDMTVITGSSAF